MTIYEVLRGHYADLAAQFARIDEHLKCDSEREARTVFQDLAKKLLAGMHAERTSALPRFAFAGLREEVAEVLRHHALIDETVAQLRIAQLPAFHWHGVLELLQRLVQRHIRYFEEDVFPFAQLTLDPEQTAQIERDYFAFVPVAAEVAGASITYDLAS